MIGKLKRRFTLLATVSMLVLMAVLVLIMNLVNLSSVISESDTVLDMLAEAELRRADQPFDRDINPDNMEAPGGADNMDAFIPRGMSPEVPYESRYFSVNVAADGSITSSNLSRIISVDQSSMQDYIEKAMEKSTDRGFIGNFRYLKTENGRETSILFLDCGRKLDAFDTFLWVSISVGLFGCLLIFLGFLFAAGRIVKPIAESYEKQKRFISDAGHEIKTPLTIINANVDLLECEGEKEELTDIRQQTDRLTRLTNSLVYLSKMEESGNPVQKVALPLSDLVQETAAAFHAPARARSIVFQCKVEPGISAVCSPDAVRQLINILLENAVKYAPDGGFIELTLTARKHAAVLTVFNTTRDPIPPDALPRVFDRFYRTDSSRNSATGGHGIGLSIARAITDSHNGSISASPKTGSDFLVTVILPQ